MDSAPRRTVILDKLKKQTAHSKIPVQMLENAQRTCSSIHRFSHRGVHSENIKKQKQSPYDMSHVHKFVRTLLWRARLHTKIATATATTTENDTTQIQPATARKDIVPTISRSSLDNSFYKNLVCVRVLLEEYTYSRQACHPQRERETEGNGDGTRERESERKSKSEREKEKESKVDIQKKIPLLSVHTHIHQHHKITHTTVLQQCMRPLLHIYTHSTAVHTQLTRRSNSTDVAIGHVLGHSKVVMRRYLQPWCETVEAVCTLGLIWADYVNYTFNIHISHYAVVLTCSCFDLASYVFC